MTSEVLCLKQTASKLHHNNILEAMEQSRIKIKLFLLWHLPFDNIQVHCKH